jgi:hypothetical protein
MSGKEIDYIRLQKEILSAARQAFSLVRQQHADETFYAFGLATDSDVVTISPISNSEEGLQRLGQAYGEPDLPLWLRWSPDEWEYWGAGDEYFAETRKTVGAWLYEDEDDGGFVTRKKGFLSVFAAALKELDAEGFFGEGEEREAVTLLLHITDPSDFEVEWMLNHVRELNPEQAYRGYVELYTT